MACGLLGSKLKTPFHLDLSLLHSHSGLHATEGIAFVESCPSDLDPDKKYVSSSNWFILMGVLIK